MHFISFSIIILTYRAKKNYGIAFVEKTNLSFRLPYFQVIEPKMKQIPVDQEKLRSYRVTFCYLYTVSVIKYD